MNPLRDYPFRIYYSPADNPLTDFYIPALSASVQYDRSAGYFSSTALAVAAKGVARLVRNGGRMRLLVGAELDRQDVEAIEQGVELQTRLSERLMERFSDPEDALLRKRLEVLAWMVAEGTLEIRVVLPRDERGLPIPADQTRDYYHPKSGIFTDANGDRVAFSGSVNETAKAWQRNYEEFSVYLSWGEGASYLPQVVARFERLWEGKDRDWIALGIPAAVRQKLLQYRPDQAPERDPLEEEEIAFTERQLAVDKLLFQYVRDAPYLPNAGGLGAATAAIRPWPHQMRVAAEVIADYPRRAMFCDEVGLGKTIEAGLVIRQLVLSGRVERCLILAPKSVLKQWQEELYEKFNLSIPRYDGSRYLDLNDQPLPDPGGNPWEAYPLLLASSQLAKRADRREQLLDAAGWDLLVVDEAHHARRKDFKERIYRPNRLLGLLNELQEAGKVTGLLLMTATPMQVHPLEVYDLLQLLGLGGKWGADEENFLDYFSEMRKDFEKVDWEFVFDMLRDELETGGELDENFVAQVEADLGPVRWASLKALIDRPGQRTQGIKQLGKKARSGVKELARRHTPLRRFIFRNTRDLLREYQRKGILKDKVPTRDPKIRRVRMRPEEEALYHRIEEYISDFYARYEAERRGLGFVMTVYRRRLTSSFYAVRCSLERRLKYLQGELGLEEAFTDDDLEQEELSLDVSESVFAEEVLQPGGSGERRRAMNRFAAELAYLRDFIRELKPLATDSKLEYLKGELNQIFRTHSKVLLFTQYTDTMDYLRDELQAVYGSEVACYSGRGGEIWNGIAWVPQSKEAVKQEFKEGKIRILLCTDSASEGLNLQTCGVLINYDMPWNPMRVEQRIGRIDRIGQKYDEVWIRNYFYKDTIEDVIYQRLADRIDWFEVVVGDLQPILAAVEETTRRLAMLPQKERWAELEREIASLKQRIQNRKMESLNLDLFAQTGDPSAGELSPVTLEDLEALLTRSAMTGHLFRPHPEIRDAYLLCHEGKELPVTFSPACFDEHPGTVQFLSYGSPLLAELLEAVPEPDWDQTDGLERFAEAEGGLELRAWYAGDGEGIRAVETLGELKSILSDREPAALSPGAIHEAEQGFRQKFREIRERQAEVIRRRQSASLRAERAKAQRLLVKAALVELALGQQPEMFEQQTYPSAFSDTAISGLRRHGYPWAPLLRLAYEDGLRVEEEDPYYQQIKGSSRDSLKGRLAQLTEEARRMVRRLGNGGIQ